MYMVGVCIIHSKMLHLFLFWVHEELKDCTNEKKKKSLVFIPEWEFFFYFFIGKEIIMIFFPM